MTAETRPESTSETSSGGTPPSVSRRRLFKGVAGGTGVLLSVHAKTALGSGLCRSPSAMMSGNTSQPRDSSITCSGGRSPGFWKVPQKFNFWPTTGPKAVRYATFRQDVSVCASGMQGLRMDDVRDHGTKLSEIFPGASSTFGLWAVLAFPDEAGGQLLRHLTAAYLNSLVFTGNGAKYPLTPEQVKEMWLDLNSGNMVYCPGTMLSCGTPIWDRDKVISYIQGMYDINSELGADPDLCKK